jgi:alanine racemase
MNVTTIDVTDIEGVEVEDEVTLLGQGVSAEEWGRKIGTINYEVVTRLPGHLPRMYLGE